MKLVEAAEMGKSSQASISKAGAVDGRLSEHKHGKEAGKQERRGQRTPEVKKSCGSCGRTDHGSGLQERLDAPCPAFSIKCSVMGHFEKYCPKGHSRSKSRGRGKVAGVTDEEEEESTGRLGSLSAEPQ